MTYRTSGTCSQAINFDLEDGIVKNVVEMLNVVVAKSVADIRLEEAVLPKETKILMS